MRLFNNILSFWRELSTEERTEIRKDIILFVEILLAGVLMFFICVSCKTKTIVVTEVRDQWHHDTTQIRDSIYQYRFIKEKGDTIYIHDSIDRFRWRDRIVETFIHDSIPYEVEVIREVNKLNSWQHFIQGSGYAFWVFLILAIIALVIYIIIKIKT